jgi:hypothetical protein
MEKQIEEMMEQHRCELLRVGAACRLLLTGDLEAVLPLDDASLLDAARPVTTKARWNWTRSRLLGVGRQWYAMRWPRTGGGYHPWGCARPDRKCPPSSGGEVRVYPCHAACLPGDCGGIGT